jgi:hypothetical protein
MDTLKIAASELTDGRTVRCSSCQRYVTRGRVYDLHVTLWDETGETARTHGAITLCGACRSDFDGADFELDAPGMERRAEIEDLRREIEIELDDFLGSPKEGNQHLTFPSGKVA